MTLPSVGLRSPHAREFRVGVRHRETSCTRAHGNGRVRTEVVPSETTQQCRKGSLPRGGAPTGLWCLRPNGGSRDCGTRTESVRRRTAAARPGRRWCITARRRRGGLVRTRSRRRAAARPRFLASAQERRNRSLPDAEKTVVSMERGVATHPTRALRLGGRGRLNAHSRNHDDHDRNNHRTAGPPVSRRFKAS